ncbi:MAG: LysE family transporter [Prolixibacteraceae bacterium]|nr:LysE family transporter [Prolixibacteraceae bacterium]
MVISLFIKGLLIGCLVSMPVGPLAVLVIQRTANRNFKSGFYSGLGVALTDTLWALIAGFSISYIITFLRQHQSLIQLIGAIILFMLGLSIFLSHPVKAIRKFKQKGTNPFQCFITAILVALSNPLVVLAYIGIFASTNLVFNIHQPSHPLSFLLAFFIGASTWWLILTTVLNFFRHKFNLRILWWFNKISGSLIMLFVLISTILVLINGNPKI